MARTHRDKINNGVARLARWNAEFPIGAFPDQHDMTPHADRPRMFQHLKGGNMVMSSSVNGVWDDMRAVKGRDRKAERRTHKRSERQAWKRNLDMEA